jgi:hypothetical protein
VVKYLEQITMLVRVVLFKSVYFKHEMVNRMFRMFACIINRFIIEENNQDTRQQVRALMRSVNVVTIAKEMEFMATFSMYIVHESWC